jgi:O-antigen/teichoic acid export membrane protein
LASLKKLAGQTAWYGLSSIFARFLNYLLTPYLTHTLVLSDYGEMTTIYSAIPFINVIFTYGLETTFFRFSNKDYDGKTVFSTASISLIVSTLLFSVLLYLFRASLAGLLRIEQHPEFITWVALIIACDTLATLPFAKLRNDGKPRKYAFIRVLGILVNIGLTFFFYSFLPKLAAAHPQSFIAGWYNPQMGAGYVILANLAQSVITLLLLSAEFFDIKAPFDGKLWREMMIYSLPIMVAGFGGMINETFDRVMLGWWAPVHSELEAKEQVGIYGACYKLSILITLFIQAFRMGAEPFFFHAAKEESAPKTYARVMKFFVITICTMFLVVMLYLDVWKHFISNPRMWVGLRVVPILLIANMCLGVYYNLSIWYKLSNNTRAGATITLIGAGITLLINYTLIPYFGYMACAWATLLCYGSMMLLSYFWGQKVYHVPYATRKLLTYFTIMLLLYAAQVGISQLTPVLLIRYATGTILLGLYLLLIIRVERKELQRMPFIGKYL